MIMMNDWMIESNEGYDDNDDWKTKSTWKCSFTNQSYDQNSPQWYLAMHFQ